jgi:hypothetical protein
MQARLLINNIRKNMSEDNVADTYAKKVAVSEKIKEVFDFIQEQLPDGRYKALTITELELVEIWAIKSLTK